MEHKGFADSWSQGGTKWIRGHGQGGSHPPNDTAILGSNCTGGLSQSAHFFPGPAGEVGIPGPPGVPGFVGPKGKSRSQDGPQVYHAQNASQRSRCWDPRWTPPPIPGGHHPLSQVCVGSMGPERAPTKECLGSE